MISNNRKTNLNKKIFDFWNIVTIVSLVILAIVLLYPFSSLFIKSFLNKAGDSFTLKSYIDFFKLPYYNSTLKNTFVVCTLATIFSIALGLPMAYFTSRFNVFGKRAINLMVILSLLSPPFIGAYSWILMFGRNGFLTNLLAKIGLHVPPIYGLKGIVIVFTLKFFPYIFLYVSGALKSIDASLEEASENLGMHGLKKLTTVTFPLILPTITAGALMVFMSALADFGTPMLIGEGYKVLSVLVYDEFMSEIGGNTAMASALSVIIIIAAVTILFIQNRIVAKKTYNMSALRPPAVKELSMGKRILASGFCFLVAIIAMLQQIVVIVTSFLKTRGPIFLREFSLDNYRVMSSRMSRNIVNTFSYSIIAIIIMIIAGMLISYVLVRRKNKFTSILDALVMFPYVIPGAVLGITLLVAFNKGPIVISGTATILILAYVIRKLPYTIRSSAAILHQIDPSIEEASINLGVSPMKTFFKTTARLMAPGVFSGAVLSWITTINELSSSIILYTGKTATITVAVYTEVMRASFGTAAALASILSLATIISIIIFNKLSGGQGITL